MSSEKRQQPLWTLPQPTGSKLKLELYNSLTRGKTEFVPLNSERITWYNCGPTVYDSSHMGHARSYITFDIIRRVLRDYFRYPIFFVQNVTDIDDKIIRRARQKYLFEKYQTEVSNGTKAQQKVFYDVNQAIMELEKKLQNESDQDKKSMLKKLIDKAKTDIGDSSKNLSDMITMVKDVLSIWLDHKFGHEITDREIFISLPRFYENEYNNDMRALNILPPDCITRVSEFVTEVINYIKKIIDNGYAYESNGSVYFDTEKFASCRQHFYAKLVPEAYGDSKALVEGEGDLLNAIEEKRNVNDFALWKNSKPGEPWWPSPWGNGRPGWHIECSVMASSVIGQQMDIHSGGVDLRFPHHDNEMAQSEAYYNTGKPWVNYFLHSGHLTISGCKMSKSLKNFITIKDALQKNTARQLRIAFLLHSWKDTLDYSDNTMNDAIHFEKTLNEFFLTVKDILRQNQKMPFNKRLVKWELDEMNLYEKFIEHSKRIDQALHDNIDTKKSCEEIRRLITVANIYIQSKANNSNSILLFQIARYITRMMDIFGCMGNGVDEPIGFPLDPQSSSLVENKEQLILPFIESIARIRDDIRSIAKELKNKQLFSLCDQIRDDIFPELGIRMEDYETIDGQQKWRLKLVNREQLLQEKEKRLEEMELTKRQQELKLKKKQQDEQLEPPVDPKKMFQMETDKYSRFDENGVPTHDNEGKELTKSALKKIAKRLQTAEKKYNDYLKKMGQL